ncbi:MULTISPECIES: ABC transporter permease [unclassified Amycolatopsis]|uniref:ABC transporter permease n=1 Tax=unclassified Amycolatopsis TaxID=2618356 RepID=UPI002876F2BB|nr:MULTISPECIES: ABC transporter permease [unclassified Amycolatopsis]MDS0135372.1 ABC transporter permease [Amycolatopsis sp. 505]MDS0140937.1 ABC transporter permease [Amycolatopsis sp. CM201R]
MNAVAVRAGVARGWIEFKQTWTNLDDVVGQVVFVLLFLGTLFFMRNATLPGTSFSLGAATVPGVLGAGIVFQGLTGAAGYLAIDREDGTLLRAKATPNGMLGYLIGKTTALSLAQLTSVAAVLVPCLFAFSALAPDGVGSYLHLLGVLVLGMAATMPIGAALGSLANSARSIGLITLPVMGMGAISGIFYPITALPVWVQDIAQVFPMYWLGLGMRSALLPDGAVVVEIGQSWRPVATVAVLLAWAVLGFALAPVLLRRMARREAGSSVAERRQKAMQRVG